MTRILGLDISSSVIGISVIKVNDAFIHLESVEYYEPPSTQKVSLFKSLIETKKYIIEKIKHLNPDKIVIEDIAEHFAGGASTSKTIIKLAVYNRTIGLSIYETFNIEPIMINVNTIRSIIRPKDHVGRLLKEDVPQAIEKILNIKFPYEYKKSGQIDSTSYDMADAISAALAYQMALDNNKPLSKVKKKKTKKKNV